MMGLVHIDYRTISWGGPNEDDNSNVWEVENGANDPGEITLEDFGMVGTPIQNFPAQPTFQNYTFAFWNVGSGVATVSGYPSTATLLNVPDMPGAFSATAWYVGPGGGPGGVPVLRCRTFDTDLNDFRKETPIHSAIPKGAWPGPNSHSVMTEGADATATAKTSLTYPAPFQNQPPGEPPKNFKNWLAITPSVKADPAPGLNASCKAMTSGLALAFFGHGQPAKVGKPSLPLAYDYWAEFWGKRGVEGEGPWGPHGPAGPWGPLTQRWFESLKPEQQALAVGMLAAKLKSGQVMP
jgi:hypothetical protein